MKADSSPPRLSIAVVIPTYNRSGLLRLLLEALTRQERPPDEVIVVNNNSTDDTADVLRSFAQRLPLRSFLETERGAGAARNAGIRHATGDILAFTDDDCIPDPRWLLFLELSFLRDPRIGMVAGQVEACPDPATLAERFAVFNHKLCEGATP